MTDHLNQPRGERHHKSRLTWEDVRWIRAHPEVNNAQAAKRYGVARSTVRSIRENVTWRDPDFTPTENPFRGAGYKSGYSPADQ